MDKSKIEINRVKFNDMINLNNYILIHLFQH